jgi:hypothetical protein
MYIEERIEKLEQEIQELKVKLFQKDWKELPKPWERNSSDYLYNPSLTIFSEPDLETTFASPWDLSEIPKNPLDTIAINAESVDDICCPSYPDIIGSWDDSISLPDVMEDSEQNINSRGLVSEFDIADKDFVTYLKNAKGLKNENNS